MMAGVSRPENRRRRIASFASNVVVNVLANLIAAGIVYIGGSAIGVFPRSPQAVAASVTVVLVGGIGILTLLNDVLQGERSATTAVSTIVLLGATGITAGIADMEVYPSVPRWAHIVLGTALLIVGVRLLRTRRRSRRRISGLHWVGPS